MHTWPSETWRDVSVALGDFEDDSYRNRVTSLATSIDFGRVEEYPTSLLPSYGPCHVIQDRYTWGQSFLVFEIRFDSGVAWVIRFAMSHKISSSRVEIEAKIRHEASVLGLVRSRTKIPIPEIIAYWAGGPEEKPLGHIEDDSRTSRHSRLLSL
ncbi:hypothetical protein BDV93DRAFT_566676 [Ceratobasidium sp. AG-I]|nr:hypothetical protein BDV93DRAFT_566676 [Ceratobasidium sp. AG-I]